MKYNWILLLFFLLVIVGIVFYFKNKENNTDEVISKSISPDGEEKILTYRLPTSMDSDLYAPYWGALHSIVSELPCSLCRIDAEKRMVFFHDTINAKIGHPIFDMDNWKKYLTLMCELKDKYEKNNWKQLPKDTPESTK